MHPPTALPRSLARDLNPPPVDPVVGETQPPVERRVARSRAARVAALLRKSPEASDRRPALDPGGRPGE